MSKQKGLSFEEVRAKISLAGKIGIPAADFLEHHGVKGMKWGVRKEHREGNVSLVEGRTVTGKTKIKAEGGQHNIASEDAKKAAVAKQVVRKSGTAALSNSDLQALTQRLKLEAQVKQMTDPPSTRFFKKLMGDQGKKHITAVVDQKATQEVNKMFAKQAAKAATKTATS